MTDAGNEQHLAKLLQSFNKDNLDGENLYGILINNINENIMFMVFTAPGTGFPVMTFEPA